MNLNFKMLLIFFSACCDASVLDGVWVRDYCKEYQFHSEMGELEQLIIQTRDCDHAYLKVNDDSLTIIRPEFSCVYKGNKIDFPFEKNKYQVKLFLGESGSGMISYQVENNSWSDFFHFINKDEFYTYHAKGHLRSYFKRLPEKYDEFNPISKERCDISIKY